MNLKILFRVHIVLLFLLLFAILGSASVLAALNVKSVTSNSGSSYRMMNDTVVFNVSSSSNVSVDGTLCNKLGGTYYLCAVTDSVDVAKAIYIISNDDGDETTASINVDNNIGSVSYDVLNSADSITLEYSVQDLGFNNNNLCSGISSISVYDGTSILNTVQVDGVAGTCMYTGSINLSIADSGTKSLSLEVTDNAGNVKRTPAQNITLDMSAPEVISGLTIKYSGTDDDLSVISESASFIVDIYFSIREDNLESITLDLSALNTNAVMQYAYRNVNVPLSNCEFNSTSTGNIYNCVINGVPLKLSGNTLNINVTAIDIYGSVGSGTLTKSFTVDNVEPTVSITTDTCDSTGRCYIHTGSNNIIVTSNKDNFEKKYIFFTILGSSLGINKVQNCSGTICTATVSLTCDSGSQADVSIAGSSGFDSQDDAGNIVQPYATYFYCDNTAPAITNITVTGESSSVIKDILVSGSTLTITADVLETESIELHAEAWLDKIKNATEEGACTKTSDYGFRCIWTVSSINDGYYDAEILLNISDSIGNTALKSSTVRVFGYRLDNETPDVLKITPSKVYPAEINRIVLSMATGNDIPYYVYATYKLSVKPGMQGKNISVLHQQVDVGKCIYKGVRGTVDANVVFSEITISNPYSTLTDTGRVDLKFLGNYNPNLLDDEFTIVCNISAIVKQDNKVYKKTQELPLEMTFTTVNTKLCDIGEECTPGEVLGRKIAHEENGVLVRAKLMGQINSLIPKLQEFCSMRDYLGQATTASQFFSMAMNGVSVYTGNIEFGNIAIGLSRQLFNLDACLSGSTSTTGMGYGGTSARAFRNSRTAAGMSSGGVDASFVQDAIQSAASSTIESASDAKEAARSRCTGFVGEACDYLSCTTTDKASGITTSVFDEYKNSGFIKDSGTGAALPDLFGDGTTFTEQSKAILTKNVNVPDVKNSIVMAAASRCWPAVYYNVNKWRQTECNYLYCLKMASYTGTDISACDSARKAQVCSVVVGEIFELPGARNIKNLMENAADYSKNFLPLAATSLLKKSLCPAYAQDAATGVFGKGSLDLPKDLKTQAFQVYGCQLPLQIARLVDINTRSTQRAQFVYPETPDMCVYAECIGEEDCEYEPDFWETINKINLPKKNSTVSTESNKALADANINVKLLDELISLEDKKAVLAEKGEELNAKDTERITELVNTLKSTDILSDDYTTVTDYKQLAAQTQSSRQQAASTDANTEKLIADRNALAASLGVAVDSATIDKENSYAQYNYESAGNAIAYLNAHPDATIEFMNVPYSSSDLNKLEELQAGYKSQIDSYAKLKNLNSQIATGSTAGSTASSNPSDAKASETKLSNIEYLRKRYTSYYDCIKGVAKDKGTNYAKCTELNYKDPVGDTKIYSYMGMGDKDTAYADLTIDKQMEINQLKLKGYTALQTYDKEFLANSMIDFSKEDTTKDSSGFTLNEKMKSRYLLWEELGYCGKASSFDSKYKTNTQTGVDGCRAFAADLVASKDSGKDGLYKQYTDKVNAGMSDLTNTVKTQQKVINQYKKAQQMGDTLYIALQALNAKHMIDWMFTPYWTERMFGVDLSDYLDFNKYKESLCNPENPINLGGDSTSDTVISCSSGYCQAVLTYAAERTELQYPNKTGYNIYTAVYYISGGDLRGRNITYNVYFTGPGVKTVYGFMESQALAAYDIVQEKTVFKSSEKYTRMCITFSERFPPENSLNNADEYCRDITTGTTDAFNTGSPWASSDNSTTPYGSYTDTDASTSSTNSNVVKGVFE